MKKSIENDYLREIERLVRSWLYHKNDGEEDNYKKVLYFAIKALDKLREQSEEERILKTKSKKKAWDESN